MIQRIQTIWLLLASAVILALFLFPYLQFTDLQGIGKALKVTGEYQATGSEAVRTSAYILQTIATLILAALPLYTVFQYKKRAVQTKVIYGTIVALLLFGIWLYFSASATLQEVNRQLSANNIGVGLFLIPIAIILLLMALNGIRKDEKLIRSADRLR